MLHTMYRPQSYLMSTSYQQATYCPKATSYAPQATSKTMVYDCISYMTPTRLRKFYPALHLVLLSCASSSASIQLLFYAIFVSLAIFVRMHHILLWRGSI